MFDQWFTELPLDTSFTNLPFAPRSNSSNVSLAPLDSHVLTKVKLTLSSDTTSKTYYGFVKDTAGNNATCQVTVKRDTVKPGCTITPTGSKGTNDWYIGNVSIALTTNLNEI